jgi:SAM-dependent methyltransferase
MTHRSFASAYWDSLARRDANHAVLTTSDAASLQESGEREIAALERAELLPPAASVLDYGCGVGRLSIPLSRRVAALTSADISAAMLEELSRRAGPLASHHRLLRVTSRESLAGPFDLIVSFLVLQHMPPFRARQTLARFATALKADGRVVIDLPVTEWEGGRLPELHWSLLPPDELWDSHYYRESEIEPLLFAPAGFAIDRLVEGVREDRKVIVLRHSRAKPEEIRALRSRALVREIAGYAPAAWVKRWVRLGAGRVARALKSSR